MSKTERYRLRKIDKTDERMVESKERQDSLLHLAGRSIGRDLQSLIVIGLLTAVFASIASMKEPYP